VTAKCVPPIMYGLWCPSLILKKLPYIIICTMFLSYIWFIFVAYSVTGYQKTCLTFSNFCKCSIKVIIALSVWGQPPLHPIWQLIRGCQSRSPESGRTATPDLFHILLPNHLDNGNNNNNARLRMAIEERAFTHMHHSNCTAERVDDDTP